MSDDSRAIFESIEDMIQHVRRQFTFGGLDPAVRTWASEQLAHIRFDIERVAGDRDRIEADLLGYIQAEADNDDRDEPVCTCGDRGCPFIEGRLPREARQADTVKAGLRAVQKDHPGHPVVLDEWLADRRDRRARCRFVLENIIIQLEAGEKPDDEESLAAEYEDTTDSEAAAGD